MEKGKVTPRVPDGFVELLPQWQVPFNQLVYAARGVLEYAGFVGLDLAGVERVEVLDTDRHLVHEHFLMLRDRLGLPVEYANSLGRYLAQNESELSFPLYVYSIADMHRLGAKDQLQKSRQCHINILGMEGPVVEAMLPAVLYQILEQFNVGPFTVLVGNRRLIRGVLEEMGLDEKKIGQVRRCIHAARPNYDSLEAELLQCGLTPDQIRQIQRLLDIRGSYTEVLEQLHELELGLNSDVFRNGLRDLHHIVPDLDSLGVPKSRCRIDTGLIGSGAYHGPIYGLRLNNHPELTDLCWGGRHDRLAKPFTHTIMHGVGMGIDLTRLFLGLRKRKVIKPAGQSTAEIAVVPLAEICLQQSNYVAAVLRYEGIPALLSPHLTAFEVVVEGLIKQGFRYALLVGNREIQTDTVEVADLSKTGHNRMVVPVSSIAEYMTSQLTA